MDSGLALAIEDGDLSLRQGNGRWIRYPAIFLRDNCPCSQCHHPSGQRLIEIGDLAENPRIATIAGEGGQVRITWADGHQSAFAATWLLEHDLSPSSRAARREPHVAWGPEIAANPPKGDWPAVSTDPKAELAWLDSYHAHGFALLGNVPIRPGAVAEVGDRLGHVRVTNYGRLFDVISVPDPSNLAYTALGLGVHSDNPYRDPTPGVQLLHCLEAAAPGGDTLLVDGFAAAEDLAREDPNAFHVLSSVPASFCFHDQASDLRARQKLISVDFDGKVVAVHFNNRSIAPLDVPEEWVKRWYQAYRAFAAILKRPEREAILRLGPGDLIVLQNERALHGRGEFDPNRGRRHLQGCYVDKDGLESRRRVLRRQLGADGERRVPAFENA